jgi:hypothetical protein
MRQQETSLRATLHLCAADDYVRFRTALKPLLTGAAGEIAKRRDADPGRGSRFMRRPQLFYRDFTHL